MCAALLLILGILIAGVVVTEMKNGFDISKVEAQQGETEILSIGEKNGNQFARHEDNRYDGTNESDPYHEDRINGFPIPPDVDVTYLNIPDPTRPHDTSETDVVATVTNWDDAPHEVKIFLQVYKAIKPDPAKQWCDDMECAYTDWCTMDYDGDSDTWALSDARAHSGNYSWHCSRVNNVGYGGNEQDWLISPVITIPYDVSMAWLNFSAWVQGEMNQFYLGYYEFTDYLEVYANVSGTGWQPLIMIENTDGNWKHPEELSAYTEALFYVAKDKDLGLKLSATGGDTVQFAFVWHSNEACSHEGAWIDDVCLLVQHGNMQPLVWQEYKPVTGTFHLDAFNATNITTFQKEVRFHLPFTPEDNAIYFFEVYSELTDAEDVDGHYDFNGDYKTDAKTGAAYWNPYNGVNESIYFGILHDAAALRVEVPSELVFGNSLMAPAQVPINVTVKNSGTVTEMISVRVAVREKIRILENGSYVYYPGPIVWMSDPYYVIISPNDAKTINFIWNADRCGEFIIDGYTELEGDWNTGTTWDNDHAYNVTSVYSIIYSNDREQDVSDNFTIILDTLGSYHVELMYWENYTFSDNTYGIVYVSGDGGKIWEEIGRTLNDNSEEWIRHIIKLDPYLPNDQLLIRFSLSNTTGTNIWQIDDIVIRAWKDYVAPTTTAILDPPLPNGCNGWYTSPVTVTLVAKDNIEVDATYYSIDGGSWFEYTAPFTINIDGHHVIDYYSVDTVGNVETTHTVSFKMDTTPPTADFSYYPANPTIYDIIHFTDSSTGAVSWHWDFGDGTTINVRNPIHKYTKTGNFNIILTVEDDAGNRDSISKKIRVISPTFVNITPCWQQVNVNDTFTVNVTIDPSVGIAGVQFDLSFNASLLEVIKVEMGDLFSGYDVFFSNGSIDNVNGKINDMYGIIIMPGGNVSHAGTFARITFKAKKEGVSYLNLSDVTVGDANATAVAIEIYNGSVEIASHPWDLNHDDAVNILDLIMIAQHFGSREGEAGYDASVDLNNDGEINILDLIIVAMHFEEHY